MTRCVGFAFHPSFLAHDTGPGHPERPERLRAIVTHLQAIDVWPALHVIEPQPVDRAILELVHPAAYISLIERACGAPARPGGMGEIPSDPPQSFGGESRDRANLTSLDPDTVASPGSWEAALRAVGAVTRAIDEVLAGSLDAAFCAVRPPGHHALADRAMGFCLFNNVALGARYAQRRHQLSRVLIVDWDVHHGNGTQAIFYDDPSVLYFSTHQYPFYPGTGSRAETGHGAGKGWTLNVPLPSGAGDRELIDAFTTELLPRSREFKPELILISAGFDAHRDDPLAGLAVTGSGYAELTRIVRTIADSCCEGRIVSVLEGGYDLRALGASVEAHLRVLIGDEVMKG